MPTLPRVIRGRWRALIPAALLCTTAAMFAAPCVASAQQLDRAGIAFHSTTPVPALSPPLLATIPQPAPACRRSTARAVGQFAAGVLGAWIGGVVPYQMLDDIDAPSRRVKGDAGYQRNANVAFALGSWVGSAAMVALTRSPGCGSMQSAMFGAAIPSALLLAGYDEPYLPVLGVFLGAPAQSLGATMATGRPD